jgi:prophage antirepressor-like protein
VVNVFGEPWFVAADVCKALEIGNASKAVMALDKDENTLTSFQGIHAGPGNPVMNIIAESGFYKLIARSRKPPRRARSLTVSLIGYSVR